MVPHGVSVSVVEPGNFQSRVRRKGATKCDAGSAGFDAFHVLTLQSGLVVNVRVLIASGKPLPLSAAAGM